MKNITFTVVTLIIIGLCVAVGYFALTWMKSPSDYAITTNDTIGDLIDVETGGEDPAVTDPTTPATPTTPTTTPAADDHATLIANLEKLKSSTTIPKLGSEGELVGYIQEFLNVYFKQAKTITKKFDAATEADYKKFQAASGLPQTGQVGTQGTNKMIEWLKAN